MIGVNFINVAAFAMFGIDPILGQALHNFLLFLSLSAASIVLTSFVTTRLIQKIIK